MNNTYGLILIVPTEASGWFLKAVLCTAHCSTLLGDEDMEHCLK